MRGIERRRRKLIAQFGGGCQRCGYDRCIRALQFHHKDPSEKYLWSKSGRVAPAEVEAHPERFILLCANCHFEEHDALDDLKREMKICPVCGQSFRRQSRSREADNRGQYCSKACGYKAQHIPFNDTFLDRLWKKVDKSGDCWLWTGGTIGGYGVQPWRNENGKYTPRSVVRVSYVQHFGQIPAAVGVIHTCENRLCVKPEHLALRGST